METRPKFLKDFDQTFGSRFQISNDKGNTSQNLNTTMLKSAFLNDSVLDTTTIKTDVGYWNNIVMDCKVQIDEGEDSERVAKQYKQITGAIARKYEYFFIGFLLKYKRI